MSEKVRKREREASEIRMMKSLVNVINRLMTDHISTVILLNIS